MSFIQRFKKKRPEPRSRKEIMNARPVRNPVLTWGPDAQGDMVINVPLQKKAWISRLNKLIPAPDVRHIILDDIGADVWELCDGETSVETIRRRIAEKYKMNHKEAEASLLEHLKQLAQRKLIVAVAGPEDEPASAQEVRPPSGGRARNRKKVTRRRSHPSS
jgi:hypothetical protein